MEREGIYNFDDLIFFTVQLQTISAENYRKVIKNSNKEYGTFLYHYLVENHPDRLDLMNFDSKLKLFVKETVPETKRKIWLSLSNDPPHKKVAELIRCTKNDSEYRPLAINIYKKRAINFKNATRPLSFMDQEKFGERSVFFNAALKNIKNKADIKELIEIVRYPRELQQLVTYILGGNIDLVESTRGILGTEQLYDIYHSVWMCLKEKQLSSKQFSYQEHRMFLALKKEAINSGRVGCLLFTLSCRNDKRFYEIFDFIKNNNEDSINELSSLLIRAKSPDQASAVLQLIKPLLLDGNSITIFKRSVSNMKKPQPEFSQVEAEIDQILFDLETHALSALNVVNNGNVSPQKFIEKFS